VGFVEVHLASCLREQSEEVHSGLTKAAFAQSRIRGLRPSSCDRATTAQDEVGFRRWRRRTRAASCDRNANRVASGMSS
jgi:hypothetical protein